MGAAASFARVLAGGNPWLGAILGFSELYTPSRTPDVNHVIGIVWRSALNYVWTLKYSGTQMRYAE